MEMCFFSLEGLVTNKSVCAWVFYLSFFFFSSMLRCCLRPIVTLLKGMIRLFCKSLDFFTDQTCTLSYCQ